MEGFKYREGWVPNAEGRSELAIFLDLLEKGVGTRFDLRAWARRECASLGPEKRLEALLEPVRAEVAKSLVMLALEGTPQEQEDSRVYGEITPTSFRELLRSHSAGLPSGKRSSFFDLGSGTGKCVLEAALSPNFASATGIEFSPCTHAIAQVLCDEFVQDVLPLARGQEATAVEMKRADFFEELSWVEGDFVFCNCIMFDDDVMGRLAGLAEQMRPGSVFVSIMQELPSDAFAVAAEVDDTAHSFGRGIEAFVHVRT